MNSELLEIVMNTTESVKTVSNYVVQQQWGHKTPYLILCASAVIRIKLRVWARRPVWNIHGSAWHLSTDSHTGTKLAQNPEKLEWDQNILTANNRVWARDVANQ